MKSSFPFFLWVVIIFWVTTTNYTSIGKIIFFSLFIPLGYVWIYKVYKKTPNVFYDNEFLYLISKEDKNTIPLQNIKTLKLSGAYFKIMGFCFNQYILSFKNNQGTIETLKFYEPIFANSFWKFQEFIKQYHPSISIENYTRKTI